MARGVLNILNNSGIKRIRHSKKKNDNPPARKSTIHIYQPIDNIIEKISFLTGNSKVEIENTILRSLPSEYKEILG